MSIRQDVRFAARALRRAPLFTGVALATLSLGLGAATAIFTLVNAILLRDLPVRHPEQLVRLATASRTNADGGLSFPMFQEIGRRQTAFASLVGWYPDRISNVELNGTLVRADNWFVTGNFYAELGVRPFAGRLITADDLDLKTLDAAPVVVLGHRFWTRQCGGELSILGRSIRIEGVPFTVVGITPEAFTGFSVSVEPDIVAPLTARPLVDGRRPQTMMDAGSLGMTVLGRLAPDVRIDRARAALGVVWPEIRTALVPTTFTGARRTDFLSMSLQLTSASRGVERFLRVRFGEPLYLLMGISALILLIASVNLAGLLLSRTAARGYELGLRAALGGSRLQIARLVIVEGCMLTLGSALGGLLFARWSAALVVELMLGNFNVVTPSISLTPDLRVLAFTAATTVTVALLVSGGAMCWATRHGMRQSGRTTTPARHMGPALVASQIALSVVLLTIGGLLVRTVSGLRAVPLQFRTDGVSAIQVYPRPNGYKQIDSDSYQPALVAALATLPGVKAAGLTFVTPLSGFVATQTVAALTSSVEAESALNSVSPGFFRVLDVPVIAGRDFRWSDDSRAPRVAVVSQSLASQLFPSGSPLGQHVRVGTLPGRRDIEIVGVVADTRLFDVHRPTPRAIFLAHLQEGDSAVWKAPLLRTDARVNPREIARAIESLGHEYLVSVRSLDEVTDGAIAQERVVALLAGFFGTLALVLAGIGVYGLMAFAVTRRRREIGIRLALGAQRSDVLRSVVAAGGATALVGVFAGIGLAIGATRFTVGSLFGVAPRDPKTLAMVFGLLLFIALVASLVPAMRASQADPITTLRAD